MLHLSHRDELSHDCSRSTLQKMIETLPTLVGGFNFISILAGQCIAIKIACIVWALMARGATYRAPAIAG